MNALTLFCAALAASLPCLAEEKKAESRPAELELKEIGETPAAAIDAIRAAGGTVRVDASGAVDGVSFDLAKIGDADLVHVKALRAVQTVSLRFTEITGTGLAHLQALPKLTSLYLPGAAVDDEGMQQLGRMTGLVNLYVQETKITDAGLEHLKAMPALRILYLDQNKLTDAGVAHLKGLTGLAGLYLRDTGVTDAGLEHLKGMTGLAFLDVRNTKVTEAGVKKLREVLPKCDIKYGTLPVPAKPVSTPAPVLVPISLYDKDPGHLWNRVYSALMVRGPGAKPEENDLLDPPLYYQTDYLLRGDTHRTAVALLDELAQGPLRPYKMTALQRAVMQRDLLGIFQWSFQQEWTPEQRALLISLSRGIRATALTAEAIRKLPDNYAAAAAAPGAVTSFDAAKPGPFLPKDLLADDGPWIGFLSRPEQSVVASVHSRLFNWRSSFEVRLRHPDGRAAGEAYLNLLDPKNGKPAQFPPGTMWALVRRAVLADNKGMPVVSPLVESVQVRVYRSLKLQAQEAQTYFEWETRHALLLENKGFHLTTARDQFYAHFPATEDPFAGARRQETELNCYQCHTGEGIASVAHQSHLFGSNLPAAALYAVKREMLDRAVSNEASGNNGWMLLRWLWNEPAR